MPHRKPIITRTDLNSLDEILQNDLTEMVSDATNLAGLRQRLDTALVVDDDRVPSTVVTMDSVVVLADESGDEDVYTLVFPNEADIAASKLSVIAPIGVAILGKHVGQVVRARVPSGQRRIKIQDILHQPQSEATYQQRRSTGGSPVSHEPSRL